MTKPTTVTEDSDELAQSSELAAIASTAPTAGSLSESFHNYIQRVRSGDLGSLPAILGLVVLVTFFWAAQPAFGTLGNFADLLKQASPTILLAMGLVFVLLLGEIDLAAGTAAGVCACVMARLSVGYNVAWPIAVGGAILTGVVIGVLTGYLCAKVRIPSFVVTLALFLAFQGVILFIVNNGPGQTGNVTITSNFINDIYNGQMAIWLGWTLAIAVIAAYAAVKVHGRSKRVNANLQAEAMSVLLVKVGAFAVVTVISVYLLNQNRALNKTGGIANINGHLVHVSAHAVEGVPWVVPLVGSFFVLWTFVLGRTRYGRHVYAVGGNNEASRRAGIETERVRISVFVICSTMASVAGILFASNLHSVDASEGGGTTLLLAVGAAVIGGCSLFGGKGRPMDAVIGGLVVAVIANGMADLVTGNNSSAWQYIVTGAVLLLAAAVDALSRRRAGAAGIA